MNKEKPKILTQSEAALKITTKIYAEAERAQIRAEIQVRLLTRLFELSEQIDNSVDEWNLELLNGVPTLRIQMLPDHDKSHLASEIEDLNIVHNYRNNGAPIYLFQLWRVEHLNPLTGDRNTGTILSQEKLPYLHILFDDADEGLEHGDECEVI